MKLLYTILNLLFPPKCPFCSRVLDEPGICAVCERDLPWTGDGEGLREGVGDFRCAAPLWYEALAREGLLRLKFQGISAAAEPLGRLVAQCAAERFAGEFDTVTWVPVSKRRLRKRGFDQAELLAREACRLWATQPVRLLEKITDNRTQSAIREAAARRANVLGVYDPVGDARGKRILLVDDICTTGATLTECIRVLKDAGAEDVMCVTVAMTRPGKDLEKVHI